METMFIFLRYEAQAFSLRIRAHAPEGQKRFPISRVGVNPEGELT